MIICKATNLECYSSNYINERNGLFNNFSVAFLMNFSHRNLGKKFNGTDKLSCINTWKYCEIFSILLDCLESCNFSQIIYSIEMKLE